MDRTVIAITGADRCAFLQGLITNDVEKAQDAIVYAALLTPQGKFIADFFVLGQKDRLLIDVAASHAASLMQRLTMYRLRADVQITPTEIVVSRGLGKAPEGAFDDPRAPALGWRSYGDEDISQDVNWNEIEVAHVIPTTGIELLPDSYILEMGFERLNGVDFRKGCFVGQEVVARMKHKTELRKGLSAVTLVGKAMPGDAITAGDKPVGTLFRVHDARGIAYLRFDRAQGEMRAGDAEVKMRPND